ncbi:hypothetical protein PR001_g24200 [Phytophthora rubi]|uniref:Uncharacterized protein n=1 Tax=Phytophthora rubi TaxID=129364 RepID=A0A6A3ICF2_9STRA|nr:hypothetical protein PR001_g24200 [Phytophthora rubi]KAE9002806.1 hypothetical protein PR002_g17528 [Phytophthora rubi]
MWATLLASECHLVPVASAKPTADLTARSCARTWSRTPSFSWTSAPQAAAGAHPARARAQRLRRSPQQAAEAERAFDSVVVACSAAAAALGREYTRPGVRDTQAHGGAQRKAALVSANKRAEGIHCQDVMQTTWRPPRCIADMTQDKCDAVRKKWHILVEGEDVPPPIKSFEYMRFPPAMLDALKLLELDAVMENLADLELDAEDQRAHHQLQELDAALEILADLGLDADRKLRAAQGLDAGLLRDDDLEQDGDEQGGGGGWLPTESWKPIRN